MNPFLIFGRYDGWSGKIGIYAHHWMLAECGQKKRRLATGPPLTWQSMQSLFDDELKLHTIDAPLVQWGERRTREEWQLRIATKRHLVLQVLAK